MWARILSVALGVWLMTAPAILDYAGAARTNDRIVGPLVASFALVAIWGVLHPLRWVNLVLGAWLIVAPWALFYDALVPTVNSLVVGMLLMLLSTVRGKIKQRFAGGWSSLWTGDFGHEPGRERGRR
jgi:hypothetical protein